MMEKTASFTTGGGGGVPNPESNGYGGAGPLPENLHKILSSFEHQPQRQDSTTNQLSILHTFANKLGLYDAADVIRTVLDRK